MASKLGILNLPPFLLEFPSPISLFFYKKNSRKIQIGDGNSPVIAVNSIFETLNPFSALIPAIFGENLPHIGSQSHFAPLRLISGLSNFVGRRDVKRPNDPTPYSSNNPGLT